jgi:iron(III) transport system ATP-binding protein
MDCSMIRADGVMKQFGDVTAVDDASLCVARGEVVALLGPSGCGKTTLLRLIAGFERPDRGSIEVARRIVAGSAWVAPEARRVGMVFQDYALFPHLTVAANVGFGLPRRERAKRVPELLALTRLGGLEGRYPHELSGGQQQRVALARALAPAPELVLLDEPWSNVDPFLRDSLRAEVTDIVRPLGVTVLLVTHDREEAFSLADRIALMRDGTIVQEGTAEQLYFAPASRWAAEFVGAANVLSGRVVAGRVETALGAFPANGASTASAAQVLVRPELLELEPSPAGTAEVVGREFRGHDVFYRVLLEGVELVSQRPSTEVVDLGARVSIRVHDGRVPVLE